MPLYPTAWFLYARVPYIILEVLHRILLRYYPLRVEALGRIREWLLLFSRGKVQGIWWETKEAISEQSAEIDSRILRWTVDDLRGDDELEKAFETIPGFFKSDKVKSRYFEIELKSQLMMRWVISCATPFHRIQSPKPSKSLGSPLASMPPVGHGLHTCLTR